MVTKRDFSLALDILQHIEDLGYKIFYLGEEVACFDLTNSKIILIDNTIIKYSDFNRTSEILPCFTINIKANEILKTAIGEFDNDIKLRRLLLKFGLETEGTE
jgi:hypothetical protein